jgi:hypothetical protein
VITEYRLRKVVKAEEGGYMWRLDLECGHTTYREHPVYGEKKLEPPKKVRCHSCPKKAVSK